MKLSEDPNIPVLEGWVNLTEAADMLGITRQHAYKMATNYQKESGFGSLHRIGSQPAYVVSSEEVQSILVARAERETTRKERAEALLAHSEAEEGRLHTASEEPAA